MIAAIGTDGIRLIVWGIGANEDEALEDAWFWLDQQGLGGITLDMYELTDDQLASVSRGRIDAIELGIDVTG
jgi:hypothetical protein